MADSKPSACGVRLTNVPTIHNPTLPVDGNGYFSNYQLAAVILLVPWFLAKFVPFVSTKTAYILMLVLSGVPSAIAYWYVMSRVGPRKTNRCILPGKDIESYLEINDPELRQKYNGKNKIPMQVFHDSYFDGKIEVKGDMLDILEDRHDWATFPLTIEHFKYVLFNLIPEVIMHTQAQDEEQVRDHYDRGDDFYEWFLGPRMIYTSGVVRDISRKETLEELQDNKLALVCHKLELKPEDRLLDIGCGWGTLTAYAAKNFGCDATGVTLARNQAKFGNDRIAHNGVSADKARILCKDYREILDDGQKFTKIVSLEMAEHVGIRHYGKFLRQVYDLLDDDGIFVFQVAGLRVNWQYEDLNWGLFMNKYVFPGADASCALSWVLTQLEAANFEVQSVDVLGVHYSATILRWYENWKANEDKVREKYGPRWYRIWLYFLASSVIVAREGGSSVFQITLHKNLNAFHRIEGVPHHSSLHFTPAKEPSLIQ